MAEIVKQDFLQNLYLDPSGQKKVNPTIFDELRWAMQHAHKPLEQTIQLISEFHGLWTGMVPALFSFLNMMTDAKSNLESKNFMAAAKSANQLFQALSAKMPSAIGRSNNITAGNMNIPLLREFVSRAQALHPAVNNYIQLNIGKFPYFQPISESVCQHGQIVLHRTEIPPLDRPKIQGAKKMDTDAPLRRISGDKMFNDVYNLVDCSHSLVNTLFLRASCVENNIGLLKESYGKGGDALPHGHNFCMDGFNARRGKDAVQPCIKKAASKFGPAFQLVDTFFPVRYESNNEPKFFNLVAEGKEYTADKLNRPVVRDVVIPISKEEQKTPHL